MKLSCFLYEFLDVCKNILSVLTRISNDLNKIVVELTYMNERYEK